jgi:tRNA U38,U39,U40 pseudouridine synthase TruA
MKVAAKPLLGEHDFNAYRAVSCQSNTSTRIIHELEINQEESWIWFDIKANGFLKHMVRNIVGVLVAVGAGESEPNWSSEVLETRDRTMGGVTATPDGLYLCSVSYSAGYNLQPVNHINRFQVYVTRTFMAAVMGAGYTRPMWKHRTDTVHRQWLLHRPSFDHVSPALR